MKNSGPKTTVWRNSNGETMLVLEATGFPFGTDLTAFIPGHGHAQKMGEARSGSGANETLDEIKYQLVSS